jgi:VWFA-related protein
MRYRVGVSSTTGVVAILAAIVGGAVAQPPERLPIFRTDTRLVEVSVVVHDKKGAAISGLTREDFTLLEDGQPQPIAIFSAESPIAGQAEAPAAPGTADPAAPPFFSNHLDTAAAHSSVTAILFDRVNTRLEDQRPARDQIVRFLKGLQPGDRVALYSLELDRVRVLHDFTSDSASLIRAISRPIGTDRPPDDPDLAAWVSDNTKDLNAMMQQNRVNYTLDSLLGLAGHLAGIRGRKSLVWVSSGIPWEIQSSVALDQMAIPVSRAARVIDDANVAIYPVDARGQVVTGVNPAETMPEVAAMKGRVTSTSQLPPRGVAQPVPNLDSFKALAASTGGRAFFNRNDIGTAIRSAVDDGRVTYMLAYYPSHGKWNGAFHRITVKTNRPDLEVRHRSGYVASPIPAKPPTTKPGDDLLEEARSPLAATGIGLNARVIRPDTAAADGHEVTVSIHVDPGAISIWRDGTDWSISLGLAIAQFAPDGQPVKSVVGNVDVGVPASRYEQVLSQGFSFSRTIALAETATEVHLVLRDPASGATGSVIIPTAALRK